MLEKAENAKKEWKIVLVDDLVPKEHLLRKIEKSIDFTELYAFVEDKYSKTKGRPSIDPVVLIKIMMLQHLYETKSLRRTVEKIKVNAAYRWFLGYSFKDKIPHFSTVSYNFLHRYDENTVEQIFNWILDKAVRKKFVKTDEVFIDATHIKANANKKKYDKVDIPATAKAYTKQLFKDVNTDREENGKKPLIDDNRIPVMPYRRPQVKKGFYEYVYDEYYNCVICPENQVLSYFTTNREFKSNPKLCKDYINRNKCTKLHQKVVLKYI